MAMWNSAPMLQTFASWALIIALVSGCIAAAAGFVGTIAGNRAASLSDADANLRIANANARADEARLEAERIRLKLAWRRVPPGQAEKLKAAMLGFEGKVNLQTVELDPEAYLFWRELSEAFKTSGVETLDFVGPNSRAFGVTVKGEDGVKVEQVARALLAAGVAVHGARIEKSIFADVEIMVGSKLDAWDLSEPH